MSGGLLALDLATVTGWAYAPIPAAPPPTELERAASLPPEPLGGTFRSGEPGCSVGRFLSLYGDWLARHLADLNPAGVIYEAPILPEQANHATTIKLMGLAAVTELICHRRRIPWVRTAQPSSVKLTFTGHGRATKDKMIAACKARGWTPIDDNHGDALALWEHGCGLVHTERARRREAT
ncbi:hypothetical protein A6A04_13360 [Paramagnetospirillum marisnigri]|uniref:Uncharacterized protein n=1 Tax=Paramagnetospirillum marisnigri TaxID=1285242 RepID=A0A178MWM1_9PROT|nr:hypothetical protein [Paramagnetospirillum marisnigri]OAN53875.1 hypothetical protein A6A04_13360 [Paramagnetospirillum marisnigri]